LIFCRNVVSPGGGFLLLLLLLLLILLLLRLSLLPLPLSPALPQPFPTNVRMDATARLMQRASCTFAPKILGQAEELGKFLERLAA